MERILLLILITLLPVQICAQYTGGSHDGDSFATTSGIRLDGSIGSFSVLYKSGNGDGSHQYITNAVINGNTLTLYNGGLGDGYSKSFNTELLSGFDLTAIYNGNNGDGFSSQLSNATVLNGENLAILYSGNDGDGFAVYFLADVLLQGIITNLYNGGIGDGFANSNLPDILLIGFMTELYKGGSGDGFASVLSSDNFLNGLMIALFQGGDGDGFASEIHNSSLTLDVIEELVKLDILLYPNPANHIVHIKSDDSIIIDSIELYDVAGKSIPIDLSDNNTLNVSNLSEGMYLLNIYTYNGSVTKKLIVKK